LASLRNAGAKKSALFCLPFHLQFVVRFPLLPQASAVGELVMERDFVHRADTRARRARRCSATVLMPLSSVTVCVARSVAGGIHEAV
jgi:hypothetical protein